MDLRYLSVIVGFIFVLSVAFISVANTHSVTVFLPFTSLSLAMPLYVVLMFTAVVSFLLGVMFMVFHSFMVALRKRKKRKEEAKQAEEKADK